MSGRIPHPRSEAAHLLAISLRKLDANASQNGVPPKIATRMQRAFASHFVSADGVRLDRNHSDLREGP